MEKPCTRTHSRLDPEVQLVLERAFDKVRRFATGRMLRGGAAVPDVRLAKLIESMVDDSMVAAPRKADKNAS